MDVEKVETTTPAQILWQCRRGMLELDLLLLSFCNHCYPTLSEAQKHSFVQLLSHADQELYEWLLGKSDPPDSNLHSIVQLLRQQSWKTLS